MVKSGEDIDALAAVDLGVIDALKTLKQDADVLRERLSGLDAVKADFEPAVYERVSNDYRARLADLDAKAEPLRRQARETYAQLRGLLAQIASAHEAVKLDRQEIELRHRLGEYDDSQYGERVRAIEEALRERTAAHERGEALRARFLEVFASEDELLKPVAPRASAPAAPPAPPAAAPDPIVTAPGVPLPPPPPGPASTQEMPAAADPVPTPAIANLPPAAQTQILQVLKLPEPPRVPPPPPTAPAPGGVPTAASPTPTFGPNATMSLRTARLVPQNPEAGRTAVPLPPKPVSLGADGASDIRIGGPGVEPRHAQITVDSKGYTIADLGSKSGTRVNAEIVQERLLKHEDVIQIGMARFVFREG